MHCYRYHVDYCYVVAVELCYLMKVVAILNVIVSDVSLQSVSVVLLLCLAVTTVSIRKQTCIHVCNISTQYKHTLLLIHIEAYSMHVCRRTYILHLIGHTTDNSCCTQCVCACVDNSIGDILTCLATLACCTANSCCSVAIALFFSFKLASCSFILLIPLLTIAFVASIACIAHSSDHQ
jgi:hypothetical protein